MFDFFCTIFTPTYNREKYLERLYNSLISQSFKDFEWLIVDDGSTDKTEAVVKEFIKERKISITYIKTINGGKHRAINKGLEFCKGSVFAIVDSDDYLVPNAIEKIYLWFQEIKKSNLKYCGVAGNKGYDINRPIGTFNEAEYVDASNIERTKFNISGDKFEVYYTEILKKYTFPTYEGENFMSEIVVWTRMAKDGYLLRWYKKIIYICNYLEDGLTKNNYKLLSKNPKGYALRIREQVKYARISNKQKMGYYATYFLINKNKTIKQCCKDLDASMIEMIISIILKKILIFIRREGKEFENI